MGARKLDRNNVFGGATRYPTLNCYVGSDIGKPAPRPRNQGAVVSNEGTPAVLFLSDHRRARTMTCKVRWRDTSKKPADLQFDLTTIDQRRILDIGKTEAIARPVVGLTCHAVPGGLQEQVSARSRDSV